MASQDLSVSVRVQGTIANLFKADREMQKGVKISVRNFGESQKSLAIQLAPEDKGTLKRSIDAIYSPQGFAVEVGSLDSVMAAEGARPHAEAVEFGTENSPAQPYMLPAYDSTKPKFDSDIRKEVRAALDRVKINRA